MAEEEDQSRFGDRAEADKQFKVPPAFGESGNSQEPTQRVDNFSPPGSFKVPAEMPKDEMPKKEPEEVEDVFDKLSQDKPEVELKKEAEPASAPNKQKLDIPQEKRSCACLWPMIIALILIIFLAGAVFINEWGIFDLGLERYYGAVHLEKLWGGLPKESKTALGYSFSKMNGKSFNLDGSAKADLFSSSLDVDIESEVKIEARIENKDKMEIGLSSNLSSDSTVVSTLLAGETEVLAKIIYSRPDIYLENSNLKKLLNLDKDWFKIKEVPPVSDGPSFSPKIGDLASGGERVGSGKINNVSCYVYDLKINSAAFSDYLKNNFPELSWLAKDLSFQSAKFYLGKRDHLIYKVEITTNNNLENASLGSKLVLNFKNIGSKVQVVLPAEDETAKKSWDEVRAVFSDNTPSKRDEIRKINLKEIQAALANYKAKNNNYPSTNGLIEKTKDETSALKSALAPDYLKSLPLDPLDDKYYYGYKSDSGASYELSSILEDKSDPEGEDISGFWVYKLKGD